MSHSALTSFSRLWLPHKHWESSQHVGWDSPGRCLGRGLQVSVYFKVKPKGPTLIWNAPGGWCSCCGVSWCVICDSDPSNFVRTPCFPFTGIHTACLLPWRQKLFFMVTSCLRRVYLSAETALINPQDKRRNKSKGRRKDRRKFGREKLEEGQSVYSLVITVGHCTSRFVFPPVVSVVYIFCSFSNPWLVGSRGDWGMLTCWSVWSRRALDGFHHSGAGTEISLHCFVYHFV